jgi:hypothetical protein
MGAVGNAERSEDVQPDPKALVVERELDNGWRILSLPNGQLVLTPPSPGAYAGP